MPKPLKKKSPLDDNPMCKAETTPVYQTARLLCQVCVNIRAQLPSGLKYLLGDRLVEACQMLMESILWTYVQGNLQRKVELARSLLRKSARIRARLRSAYDTQKVPRSFFVEAADHLNAIERQVTGWIGSMEKKFQDQSLARTGDTQT